MAGPWLFTYLALAKPSDACGYQPQDRHCALVFLRYLNTSARVTHRDRGGHHKQHHHRVSRREPYGYKQRQYPSVVQHIRTCNDQQPSSYCVRLSSLCLGATELERRSASRVQWNVSHGDAVHINSVGLMCRIHSLLFSSLEQKTTDSFVYEDPFAREAHTRCASIPPSSADYFNFTWDASTSLSAHF